MRKSLWMTIPLLCVSLGAPGAKADTVEVGTATIASAVCKSTPSEFCGTAVELNLMTGTNLIILGYVTEGETVPGTPYPLAPGDTVGYIGYSATPGVTFSLYGDIASAIFTVGGVTYSASDLDWATATWAADFNGVLPIDVTASVVSAAPEPSSSLLFLMGAGFMGLILALQKRSPVGSQQAS